MAYPIGPDQIPMRDSFFHILPTAELVRQISSLHDIVTKFTKWDDTLSIQIHEWYEEISLLDTRDSPSVTKKISELVSVILINPITGAPLKHPILDGYTVWEASTLHECKEFSRVSPVSKEPFEEVERVHEFAVALFSWIEPIRAVAPPISQKPLRLFSKEDRPSDDAIIPYSSWALMPDEERNVVAMAIYGRIGCSIQSQRTWQLVRRNAQRLIATSHERFVTQEAQIKAESAAASQKIKGQITSHAQAMDVASAQAKLKTEEDRVLMKDSAEKEAESTKAVAAAAAVVADKSREVGRLAAQLAGMRA